MSLSRLIILGLLAYLLYRLIFARPKEVGPGQTTTQAHDVLVEDPVCHTYVPAGQAITIRHHGSTVNFCSKKCRDEFLRASKNN